MKPLTKKDLWNPIKDQLKDADMLISIGIRRLLEIDPEFAKDEELEVYIGGIIDLEVRYAEQTKVLRESNESTPVSNR